MRAHHFLNPRLPSASILSIPKPFFAPTATFLPFRDQTLELHHPPMAPPNPLAEPDVGISCFVSSVPGFRGVLKQRYSDFIVNEVARDGTVVHLTSFDLPQECVDVKEEDKVVPSGDADHSQALESFRVLCGDADCDALKGFLERVSDGGDSDVSPIILSADADKAHRSETHNFFKKNFKFLVTDTVEGADGIQKSIRVRLASGAGGGRSGGGRGRKRKGMGNSDWRDDRPFDSRGSANWPQHVGKFLRFHLYKENKDTQEALRVIGKMLGLQPRSFGFAGTKDKRSVSTQQVTVFKVQASRLAALNSRLFGIKVGDFCYVKDGLVLGQLTGNRFTITLRAVFAESEDVIRAAVDGLGGNGFINYYGLQRFGSGSVPTHIIGAALLRGEWKDAVSLILDPREGERDDIKEIREHYKKNGDIDTALRNLPRNLIAERAILQCLKKCPGNYLQALKGIPRTLRMIRPQFVTRPVKKQKQFLYSRKFFWYVHSYQSYLWNHAASMRVEEYGISQVVQGDLVYKKESSLPYATVVDTLEAAGDHSNSSEIDTFCETLPEEVIRSVKIVDSEDLLEGFYTFEDVVLPLPGSQALFPGNDVAEIYHEMTKKDGISLTESPHGVKEFSITSMKGGYRRVFQRPIDFEWKLMTYTDDDMCLAKTDLDILSNNKPAGADDLLSNGISSSQTNDCKLGSSLDSSVPASGTSLLESVGSSDPLPKKLALRLSFTLPASSYATMAIRELLKISTSAASFRPADGNVRDEICMFQ